MPYRFLCLSISACACALACARARVFEPLCSIGCGKTKEARQLYS